MKYKILLYKVRFESKLLTYFESNLSKLLESDLNLILNNLVWLYFRNSSTYLDILGTIWSMDTMKLVCSSKSFCNWLRFISTSSTVESSITKTIPSSAPIKFTKSSVVVNFPPASVAVTRKKISWKIAVFCWFLI